MGKRIVIMNFSGVYDKERFAGNPKFAHIDCSRLNGTDCYCDGEGQKSIRRAMAALPAEGIHFIDSGDYHYVTKFWADKIKRPFSLVLLDHHTDMQPPVWSGLLSCGGWVNDLIGENALLRHVYIMGIPEGQAETIPRRYRSKVDVFTDELLHTHSRLPKPLPIDEPLYVSIDKDVLDTASARTGWEQGTLTLDDLKRVLSLILGHNEVIGIDVCGECPATLDLFDTDGSIAIDDKANSELLALFRRQGLC